MTGALPPAVARIVPAAMESSPAHGLAILLAALMDRVGLDRIEITADELLRAEAGSLTLIHDIQGHQVIITRRR